MCRTSSLRGSSPPVRYHSQSIQAATVFQREISGEQAKEPLFRSFEHYPNQSL
jgi:hypothetical protein